MTKEEIAIAIQNEFKAEFPLSHSYIGKGALGDDWFITVFLGDKASFANGIEHNDPLRSIYCVEDGSKGFVVRVVGGGVSISGIKPNETEKYLYCTREKIAFRKKQGDAKKCIEGMRKHFADIRATFEAVKSNMIDADTYSKF